MPSRAPPGRRRRAARGAALAACLAALLAAPPGAAQTGLPPDLGAGLDRLAPQAMAAWQVPGLAVAVLGGGAAVFRTYGLRDVEGGLPVTPDTLFAVGSIAKSFTVAGLAMLAEDGRLDWDRPVIDYLPEFRVHDDRATGRITPRDLVSHRTGMPRHDALWYLNAFPRDELVRRLRFLSPAAPLRSTFGYNNLMVTAAGYLAGRIAGMSWENLTRARLLAPLGMTRTRLTLAEFREAADRAAPYFPGDDGRIRIALRDTGAVAPAAAVYSSLRDMTIWLRFHLDRGEVDGRRLLSRRAFEQMRRPRIEVRGPPDHPALGRAAYGMGFYVTTYRGHELVRHPGVIDGYAALMSVMPGRGVGVVVLSNMSGHNPVPAIVARYVYDRVIGAPPLPWPAHFAAERQRRLAARRAAEARLDELLRRPAPAPRRALAFYAGRYVHPAYGAIDVTVAPDGGGLAGRLHDVRFALRHVGGDTWIVPETAWPLRAGLRVRFRENSDGILDRLATPLADAPAYRLSAGDLVFRRIADERR